MSKINLGRAQPPHNLGPRAKIGLNMYLTELAYDDVVATLRSVLNDEVDSIALIPVLNTLVAGQVTELVCEEEYTAARIEMNNHHEFMMAFIRDDELPTPKLAEAAEAAEKIGAEANKKLKAKAKKAKAAA